MNLESIFTANVSEKKNALRSQLNRNRYVVDLSEVQLGSRLFVSTTQLLPGQESLSYKEIGWLLCSQSSDQITLPQIQFDEGRSIFPLEKAKKAVLTSSGVVLIDGHHSIAAAILCGALSFPIWIVDDEAEGSCFSQLPKQFYDLSDDPWRTWTDEAIAEVSGNQIRCYTEYPIGIRNDKIIPPFTELKIARFLQKRNFSIETAYSGKMPPEQAKRVLNELMLVDDFKNVPGLVLFPEPMHYSSLTAGEGIQPILYSGF